MSACLSLCEPAQQHSACLPVCLYVNQHSNTLHVCLFVSMCQNKNNFLGGGGLCFHHGHVCWWGRRRVAVFDQSKVAHCMWQSKQRMQQEKQYILSPSGGQSA